MAQFQPVQGDTSKNIIKHRQMINLAIEHEAEFICFPELSLTGYEPQLAKSTWMDEQDPVFKLFQDISDGHQIIISLGFPLKRPEGTYISMKIFQPHKPAQYYNKQYLHQDELPYFIPGNKQIYIDLEEQKIAPAICYESLLPKHAAEAHKSGASFYLASVAKPQRGIAKAYRHYPEIAQKYSMTVSMSNCIGFCDDFESAGQSAIWNMSGKLVGKMDHNSEGILIYDTQTHYFTKIE